MSVALVDTNVLLDILSEDLTWADRSGAALSEQISLGEAVINQIVYAELAGAFRRLQELDDWLDGLGIFRLELTWEAAFLAGSAYREYRRQGGPRTSLLADFFIGAHAAVAGYPVLTRDTRRYRTYFPRVQIIEP